MMRRALIVSPHFPPSTLAGVHRGRHLAKHLPSHGWKPIVIRAHEKHYTENPDEELGKLVSASLDQIRTGALPSRVARVFGVGDIGLRAYFHLARGIAGGVSRYSPSVILITGSPFYPMLLAGWVRRRFGLPVVLDFQDPWVSAHGATRPEWSKGGLAHRLALALEPKAVRQAAWITSVSDTQNAEMSNRYPWLHAGRMSAIPIGGDPDDFVALRNCAPVANGAILLGKINICYVGTFLPRAAPVLRMLFKAVARLRSEAPELAARLRLIFVGTSNQPSIAVAARATHLVSAIAAEEGVGDLVYEFPVRAPYLEALSVLASAQGILLLGSDEPHYTASKIYPALMSGRPWLSIFHARSSAHAILTRAGGGASFCFEDENGLADLVTAAAGALRRLALEPESFGSSDSNAYAPYTAHAVAGQFARIFDTLSLPCGASSAE
ncbi:MAG: glycosyltransferase [Beijerinckiaceae bacterium]